MTKISAPAGAAVAGLSAPGGARFDADGTFETDNESIVAYCRGAGYGIGNGKPRQPVLAEAPDPREVEDIVVGTRLRDAAVDPQPTDFLPPTNAGKENPHGPLVVAPQIHASENQVVRPGLVHVDDVQKQEDAETAQATALLVRRGDVGDALPSFAEGLDTGPLGLSDPGSVEAVETAGDADPAELKGDALNSALSAAGLSKVGTAEEKRTRLAEHVGQ